MKSTAAKTSTASSGAIEETTTSSTTAGKLRDVHARGACDFVTAEGDGEGSNVGGSGGAGSA